MATVAEGSANITTKVVTVPGSVDPLAVYGTADQVIRTIERGFPLVRISARGRNLSITGPSAVAEVVAQLLEELIGEVQSGVTLNVGVVEQTISLLQAARRGEMTGEILSVSGKSIRAKTPGQQAYIDALETFPVVFGIGPAGTGKTYLAIAEAVAALLRADVKRIVLTRPAVEAGENLGFLPGTASEKIDPYLRPLFDALGDLLEEGALPKLMAVGAIEIAPLAYMRGRTLNDSYIILDEAQNTTPMQMKMFLTRLGFGSHMVVTGDDTQTDLPGTQPSGLRVIQEILQDVGDVKFSYLTSADVVRNPLVGEIIDAYARWESSHGTAGATHRKRH